MALAVVGHLHAGGALACESYPRHQGVREHRQIGPVHQRKGIRTEHGLAFSSANAEVEQSSAAPSLHHATVLILKGRNANRASSFQYGGSNRVGVRRGLDKHRPPGSAVLRVWHAMPVLDAPIDFQDRWVAPSPISPLRRKEIPVILMPAPRTHPFATGCRTAG